MPDAPGKPTSPARLKPCPICGKASIAQVRPFCSARCKDIDLYKWLSGSYAIPASDTDDDDEDGKPPPRDRDRE